jgi:hypothetical protein
MKHIPFTIVLLLFLASLASAQNNVGINDDNSSPKASAMLDVFSTTKGLLVPRIALTSTTTAAPVTTPEASLLIYNTSTAGDVTPGYYYWDGVSKWVRLTATSDAAKNLSVANKSANATLLKTENMVFANGNITLTLPVVTSADDGLEITVKNVGTYTDLITVIPQSGKTLDASSNSLLTRWQGRTFVARNTNWIVREKEVRTDNRLDVSINGSFTSIAEVVAFLNAHMSGPTVVQIGGGSYPVAATQTINLAYPVTFEGLSYGETSIDAAAGVSGTPLFNCQTECYFKRLTFTAIANTAGNDAIRFSGSGFYHEVKDSYFLGFNKGIVSTNNNDLWIFETDFENCAGAGIEIAAGSASGGSLKLSECDFTQCAKGISLLSGVAETVSILNCTFYNTASGTDIGVLYTPATFTSFSSIFITNNAWNNQGTFISGFDFSRTDGRDVNANLVNNAGMENENPHCKLTLLNNTTTVAANGTTYVKANWTATSPTLTSYTCKWNIATTNRLVYLPVNKSDVVMWISGNASTSVANSILNIGICKNGVTTTRYGETTLRTTTASQPYQFSTIIYLPDVGPGDYYELWFNSTSGVTATVIFSDLNWYVDAK